MSKIESWINIPIESGFTVENLPYGIFSETENDNKRIGVAIGNQIIDLFALSELGYLKELNIETSVLKNEYLNDFIALGKDTTNRLRTLLQQLLKVDNETLKKDATKILVNQSEATLHLPVKVGDYTDFYSSIEHATNVGKMFRDPENALLPNWKHLPVGYHGRASTIYESGVPVYRPCGQTMPADATQPVYGPTKLLDFELEMAIIIGKENQLGKSISTANASDHIFGMVLFNDWSARDIQKWEYVPLGPFLGKSFASTISPWVVTIEALSPFKVDGPLQQPGVLPYLKYNGQHNYDIDLQVLINPEGSEATVVSNSNYKYMYWNMAQQLAHHTVNGCAVKVGDMMASGTISGKTADSYGSMLELSWAGKNSLTLKDGNSRKFIEDGDTVIMNAIAQKDDIKVGFGEVRNKVLPAINV